MSLSPSVPIQMDDDDFLAPTIDFALSISGVEWDSCEYYTHEITGTIRDDFETNEVVGTIKLIQVSAVAATNNQISLSDVFDSHSELLDAIYGAIFDKNEETKEELNIEPAWNDVLVITGFDIQPKYRKTLVDCLEAAISVFAPQGLIAAATNEERQEFIGLDLTVDEWKQLGFVKIAGTQFVFRDCAMINPYSERRMDRDDDE